MSIIAVTDGAFDKEVLKSDKPVIVDFWAEWCGPCKQFGPVFEDVSNKVGGVVFAKVNIDENPEGEVAAMKVGNTSKGDFEDWIKENS